MVMAHTTALGALSVLIGAVAYAIYITKTLRESGVQPHPFSWLLWFLVTLVAFLVQRGQGGEAGSWVTGFTAIVCLIISLLTFLKNEWDFSWFDWFCIVAGILVVGVYFAGLYVPGFHLAGFYFAIGNPAWSAVAATAADVIGYGPTITKGWTDPNKDSVTSFGLNGLKFFVAYFALGSYSLATWLYPITICVLNSSVAAMLLLRREFAVTKAT